MAAAIKLWKLGERDILLIERDKAVGGVLNQCIHTGFGLEYYGQDMTGRDFAGKMTEELRKTGVEVVTDTMVTGLSGCGEMDDNGTVVSLKAGDATVTRSGEGHALRNTGENPLEVLAVIALTA